MLTASPSCLSSSGLWLMAWCSLHAGQLTSLETSSQTFPELCLLGGSKSSQTDKTEVSGVYVGATHSASPKWEVVTMILILQIE